MCLIAILRIVIVYLQILFFSDVNSHTQFAIYFHDEKYFAIKNLFYFKDRFMIYGSRSKETLSPCLLSQRIQKA